MSVRRRILLAALAVGVVGTLVVLFWSAGPKDATPKLEFTLCGYTNFVLNTLGERIKFAIVKVTNRDQHALSVNGMIAVSEALDRHHLAVGNAGDFSVAVGCSHTTSIPVLWYVETDMGTIREESATTRWRMKYFVEREILSNKLRERLGLWPLIGEHIDSPTNYEFTSDWFDP